MANPTFKKEKSLKGLASIGQGKTTRIKMDGQLCGYIQEASWNSHYSGWQIGLMVYKTPEEKLPTSKHYNPNSDWRWIFYKPHETEEAARLFLQNHWDAIITRHHIRVDPL